MEPSPRRSGRLIRLAKRLRPNDPITIEPADSPPVDWCSFQLSDPFTSHLVSLLVKRDLWSFRRVCVFWRSLVPRLPDVQLNIFDMEADIPIRCNLATSLRVSPLGFDRERYLTTSLIPFGHLTAVEFARLDLADVAAYISLASSNLTRLGMLRCYQHEEDATFIATNFAKATSLRLIVYEGACANQLDSFASVLLSNTSLTALELRHLTMPKECIETLSTSLRALSINTYYFDHTLATVLPALQRNTALKSLTWTGSNLQTEALLKLTQTNRTITSLTLHARGCTMSVPLLGDILTANGTLVELRLWAGHLGSDMCTGLFIAMAAGRLPRLRRLELIDSDNWERSPLFDRSLLNMCVKCRTLEHFTLRTVHPPLSELLPALAASPSLLEVSLGIPIARRDIVDHLLPSLATNRIMYLFRYRPGEDIDDEAAREIEKLDYRVRSN